MISVSVLERLSHKLKQRNLDVLNGARFADLWENQDGKTVFLHHGGNKNQMMEQGKPIYSNKFYVEFSFLCLLILDCVMLF